MADGNGSWAQPLVDRARSRAQEQEHVARMLDIAAKAARRYSGAARWMGRDELEQTALVEMVKGMRTFDPERGTPVGAYLWDIAIKAISRGVLKARSPASASWHRVKELREHRREQVEEREAGVNAQHVTHRTTDLDIEEAMVRTHVRERRSTPEHDLERARLTDTVRARLAELVGAAGVPFATGVLSKEYAPREIAEAHEVSIHYVYRMRQRAAKAVYRDHVLHELWQEMTP